MKKTLFSIFGVLLLFGSWANEKKVDSKIQEVTVFLNNAQIERSASVRLSTGEQFIVFKGLENAINVATLRAGSPSDVIINEIMFNSEYIVEESDINNDPLIRSIQRKIRMLNDSIYRMGWNIEDKRRKLAVLEQEKLLLLQNPIMKGQSIGDSLDLLIDATDFLRTQLNEINEATIEISQEQYYLEQDLSGMHNRLAILQNQLNEKQSEIQPKTYYDYQVILSVYSEKEQTVNFFVSYLVNNAGWIPVYDIRAGEEDQPIELVMKAKVYQNTGADWKGVQLNLSSNNPNLQKQKPVLYPWYLYESSAQIVQTYGGVSKRGTRDANVAYYADGAVPNVEVDEEAVYYGNAGGSQTNQQFSYQLYELNRKMTVPSDGHYHQLPVKSFDLKAKYEHHIVPKLDCNSYLIASIGDWQGVDILNGEANIYFQNTFIGKIHLNRRAFADTLKLSMGDDQRIFSERRLLKSGSKNSVIGGNLVKEYKYEIKLSNTTDEEVELTLEDQLPISQNEKIKIELADSDGDPIYDVSTGKLSWKLKLAPGETRMITFKSKVTHPKEMIVVGW
jgi:uncharacterized protein (TIGR02231 family)